MLEVCPGGTLQGEWVVPGDKSISHRALMLGALAEGKSEIHGMLYGEDCLATMRALQQCGVTFTAIDEKITVWGRGLRGLTAPTDPIDCQNSGTTFRLLAGILAGQPFESHLIGDPSLSTRPMRRIVEPLQQMGAEIRAREKGPELCAPLVIKGKERLQAIEYALPVASAQVKSCLLLASLAADKPCILYEKALTRDHTERMLKSFGVTLESSDRQIKLYPGRLRGQSIRVPADFSSAAFFIVGASVCEGSHILLRQVGVNDTRTGLLSILRAMGAEIKVHRYQEQTAEPIADIEVRSAALQGIDVPLEWVVSAIDEFPIIFVAAALAKGITRIQGLGELRYKESDRLKGMAEALSILGAKVKEWEEGILIEGGTLQGGVVDARGDHRLAMALAIAGMKTKGLLNIQDVDNIATSFPGFMDFANQCGLTIKKRFD